MPERLLLVDGDPRTLRVLEVTLRGAGFSVETATTGTEAWVRIESAPPGLVVADAAISGIDGFELCARLRQTPGGGSIPFILLVGDHGLDQKVHSIESGADEYLVKPTYVKEVLARVRALLQRRDRDRLAPVGEERQLGTLDTVASARLTGDLNDMAVVDLVQLVESSGRSGIVHLRGANGAIGAVYFRRGRIVDVEAGHLAGLDALSRLLSWAGGTFEVEWRNIRRNDVIARPTADLVIDGMQRLDEWNRLSRGFVDPRVVFEVDYDLLAERLAEIPDEVNHILRLCDGVRTVRQVIEDSTMPDIESLTALIRLRAEGIIYDIANRSTPEKSRPGEGLRDWLDSESSPIPSVAPLHPSSEETLADLGVDLGPPRRRTAPGLGQAGPASAVPDIKERGDKASVRPEDIRQARGEQANIITFPSLEEPQGRLQMPGSGQPVASAGATEGWSESASSDAVPSAGIAVVDVAARPPGAMSRTHRGIAAPPLYEPGPEAAIPGGATAADSSDPGIHRSLQGPDSASLFDRDILEQPGSSGSRIGLSAPSSGSPHGIAELTEPVIHFPAAVHAEPGVASTQGHVGAFAETTTNPAFPDENISHREALDELGLPSRWRALRVLVAAAVVGGAAALAVQRWQHASAPDTAPGVPRPGLRTEPAEATSSDPTAKAVFEKAASHGAQAEVVSPTGVAPDDPPGSIGRGVAARGGIVASEHGAGAAGGGSIGISPTPTAPSVVLPDPKAPTPAPAVPSPAPGPQLAIAATAKSGEALPPPTSGLPTRPSVPAEATVPARGSVAPSASAPGFGRQLENCRGAFTRNRMREAFTACTAAATANPRSAEALTLLAHTELNRGHLSRAAELASKALLVDPNVADAYVIIGGVHQDSGQNAEAKAAYRRYLQLAPHGRYADDLRSIVNSL
jgi:CheY-like chemotaxis protein/cytochrome c-type biogenesis protein CcmH/NrfG